MRKEAKRLTFEDRMNLHKWLEVSKKDIEKKHLSKGDVLILVKDALGFDLNKNHLDASSKMLDIKYAYQKSHKVIQADVSMILILASAIHDLYVEVGASVPKPLAELKESISEQIRLWQKL